MYFFQRFFCGRTAMTVFVLLMSITLSFSQKKPTGFVVAQEAATPSNYTIAGYGQNFPATTNYAVHFGKGVNGSAGFNRVIRSFVVENRTYVRGEQGDTPFTKVVLNRIDGAVVGNKSTAFFESDSATVSNPKYLLPSYVNDMNQLINSYVFNRGADNVFSNNGSTVNNVERIDLIFENGITAADVESMLNRSGILIMERGGNDPFKFAVIKSLTDGADKRVKSLGDLKSATTDSWGTTNVNFPSIVFQRDGGQTGNLKPSQTINAQYVHGIFITLADMGVKTSDVFYGISLFPNDVTSSGNGQNLVDLSSGFPANTDGGAAGGLDFMAGGGFFTVNNNVGGRIFHDGMPDPASINGNTGGTDGSLIRNLNLYVSLVGTSGNVLATVPVSNTTGAYTFYDVGNGDYSIVLHTNPNGSAVSDLPDHFYFTGEGANARKDASVDGIIKFAVPATGNGSLIMNNFGINSNIEANNDDYGTVKTQEGLVSTEMVFANDSLNGVPVVPADIVLKTDGNEVTTPVQFVDSDNNPVSGVVLNPDGTVTVEPGTAPGEYTLEYTICQKSSPANCDNATVRVNVIPEILANDDTFGPVRSIEGLVSTETVFANDSLNGVPVVAADIVLKTDGNEVTTPVQFVDSDNNPVSGVVLNPDGTVTVEPGTAPGEYTLEYTICQKSSPANCDNATVTVNVIPEILANDDNYGPVRSIEGLVRTETVFANDSLNGVPVVAADIVLKTDGNEVTTKVPFVDSDNTPVSGVVLNPDGTVTVEPGTAPGEYTLEYTICQKSSPANCDNATVTVNVIPEILANDDTFGPVRSIEGLVSTETVFANDSLNGVPVVPADIVLKTDGNEVTTPVQFVDSDNNPVSGVVLNPDGTVKVEPGTAPGEYTLEYTICQKSSPANCDNATVRVNVIPEILANDDTFGPVRSIEGLVSTETVFANDSLNGVPVVPADIVLKTDGNEVTTPVQFLDSDNNPVSGVVLNPDGTVTVEPGTAPGEYTLEYTICQKSSPANCDNATVRVNVIPEILANDDTFGPVRSIEGLVSTETVFANDSLNGVPVVPADIVLKTDGNEVTTPVPFVDSDNTPVSGVVLNPDGTVTVEPGTAPGEYTLEYTICQKSSPANCDNATVRVNVIPEILANDDTFGPVRSIEGLVSTETVFANDSLNGVPVVPADIVLKTDGNEVTTPVQFVDSDNNPVSGVVLNPDGTVTVEPGTAPGEYTLEYTICQKSSQTNCDNATVRVNVIPEILANDDTFGPVRSIEGLVSTETVFANDSLNGVPVVAADIVLKTDGNEVTTKVPFVDSDNNPVSGVVLNPDGTVTVEPGTAPGEYTLEYTICQKSSPANCDNATVTVNVVYNGSIELLKAGVFEDANNDREVSPGDQIRYTFSVKNTGDVVLNNAIINDTTINVYGVVVTPQTLQPGESGTAEALYTIRAEDIAKGGVYNIATVIAEDPQGKPVTDRSKDPEPLEPEDENYDPNCPDCTFTELEMPAIFDLALTKKVSPGQNSVFKSGETVKFTITIRNEGNVDAQNVQVVDYVPAGLILKSDTIWTVRNNKAYLITPVALVPAGTEYEIEIEFTVGNTGSGTVGNKAEIVSADGGTDVDSTPDDDPDNDTDDEDDHDSSGITICADKKCLTVKTTRIK